MQASTETWHRKEAMGPRLWETAGAHGSHVKASILGVRQTELFTGDPRSTGQLRAGGRRLGYSVPGTGQASAGFGPRNSVHGH